MQFISRVLGHGDRSAGLVKQPGVCGFGLGVAVWLSAVAAQAADLPLPGPPPLLPSFAAFSWTGLYAGVQAGYDWDKDHLVEEKTATSVPTGSVYDYQPDGFAGGVHVGINYQINAVVVGAEADFEGTTIRGSFVDPSLIGKGHDTVPWQGSVRGRLGYAFDTFMVYATGGFAYANLKNTYVFVPTLTQETFSNVVTGWTVGGGLAYAMTDHWIASAEFRHSEFGDLRNNSVRAFAGLSGVQAFAANTIKIGVSYKF